MEPWGGMIPVLGVKIKNCGCDCIMIILYSKATGISHLNSRDFSTLSFKAHVQRLISFGQLAIRVIIGYACIGTSSVSPSSENSRSAS
mmetsp:Transcript_1706/g.5049  ORF Transcript_1706/g.5049 Transcript_1706/m.5049 type:complete len:88 (-) Transcript_1706:540-803(-)